MKTTKKGFTLIELIVVIAIIGVLAAILVPTMLGYVRKSKISSANSAASSVYKAINSALTELDEEGIDVGGLWILTYTNAGGTTDTWSAAGDPVDETISTVVNGKFKTKVANFFADITKEKSVKAALKGGSCVALACNADSTYTGTYPGGVITTDSYDIDTYKITGSIVTNAALQAAISAAEGNKMDSSTYTFPAVTGDNAKYADIYTKAGGTT